MTMNDSETQTALRLQESSVKRHADFLAWFGERKAKYQEAHPGMDEWMLELTAWHEFQKERQI